MLGIVVCRPPVDPRGSPAVARLPGLAEEILREMVGQGGKPTGRLRLGPLRDAFPCRVRIVSSVCVETMGVPARGDRPPASPCASAFPCSEDLSGGPTPPGASAALRLG